MERINPLVAPFRVFSILDTQMQCANIANHHFSGQTKERKKKKHCPALQNLLTRILLQPI